jgi:glycerophosphoryl diester phosphodiesterase
LNWLTARPIAHRGLHGDGRIENSLSAARAAVAAGFAIECDIQRSADGEAVVFHDDSLERLTLAQGRIADYSVARLAEFHLGGTADPIPSLPQLLELIAGRVPLICEIKSGFAGDMRLTARAAEIAAGYDGPLAFKTFDPGVIGFLREAGSTRPLGLVAEASYDDPYFAALSPAQKRDCVAFLHVARTRPDFLSWSVDDLPHAAPSLFRALGEKPVMAWTVRTPNQWALARQFADQAVFEGRPPDNPEP